MAAGLLCSALFLALALREVGREAARPAPLPDRSRAAAPAILLAAAARPIRVGDTITADMIRNAAAGPAAHPLSATPSEILGKVATRALPAGALITRDAVGAEAKLAIRVPMGLRAVSIDTTAEIAVAGLVRPGDRVDVQVVYPGADAVSGARGAGRSRAQTLLQMVQVLAVGDAIVGAGPPPQGQPADPQPPARTITMALTPEQVSILSLARNIGSLTLSLRNPADGEQLATAAASPAPDVEPAPSSASRAASLPRPPATPRPAPPIELVVGDRRQTLHAGNAQP